jgi:hypothetical protein
VSTTEIMDTTSRVKRRHKVWPEALKREIVAACAVPGASVSMVARQYDVNTNQVFTWRRLYAEAPVAPVPQLLPAALLTASPAPPAASADVIEIELPSGYTIARVAEMLGEDEDWLGDVANEMDQEDGLIWVYGPGDEGVMAFTDFGIETLQGLIEIHKENPDLLRRSTDPL